METLKERIKALAAEQPELKNQRKTVKILGERTMDAEVAWSQHMSNRNKLRYMYAAYAILRGKDPYIADPNGKGMLSTRILDKLVQPVI